MKCHTSIARPGQEPHFIPPVGAHRCITFRERYTLFSRTYQVEAGTTFQAVQTSGTRQPDRDGRLRFR